MRHIQTTLLSLLTLAALPAFGQTREDIRLALIPLPDDLRAGASVVIADSTGFKTIRAGANGWFCVADARDDDRLSLECHPESLRPYLDRRLRLSSQMDNTVRNSLITADIRSGRLSIPVGALSRFVSGSRSPQTGRVDSVWVWSELDLPFADPGVTGLPTENAGEKPWLMRAGEHGAHVMIGYRKVGWQDFLDDNR